MKIFKRNTNRDRIEKGQRKPIPWKRWLAALLWVLLLGGCTVFALDGYVRSVGGQDIVLPQKLGGEGEFDCILVLGCKVREDGTPSHMLEDRLRRGVELYRQGAAPKILMSGDHGQKNYDEVGAMRKYAVDSQIPEEDIFCDHAGFSTYESIYRAKEIFGAERIVIVTQEYHLYRALYIAQALGVEAVGVACDYRTYGGQWVRDVREILARNKDAMKCIFRPEAEIMGEAISLKGDGRVTKG